MFFYDTNIVNGFYAKIFDMNKIELLAPCGNEESFMAAVSAGADAVYVGLKDFSARAKAKNFSYKQLNEICNYARNKNVKVFVALNTLVKDSEIKNIIKSLEQISFAQADAIIVQDLGVANLSKKYFPKIALHASTQLVIHNSYGAKQAEKAGFKRAVLARELSFDDIKKIKNNSNIELEIFCHGALCFCVSGLCLFSSFIGGYSGNRGHCTQPCRRLWTADGKNGYFLSPKDFQLADYIKQIKNIGITSLKIEGRLKSADYVTKTVKAYRLLIDSDEKNYEQNLKQAKEILALDYARQKTTFNFNAKSENIFEPQKSKNLGLYLGKAENKTDTYFCLNCTDKIFVDDTLRIVDLQKDKSQTLTVKEIKDNKIFYENLYIENGFEVYKIADGKTAQDWKKIRLDDCQQETKDANNEGFSSQLHKPSTVVNKPFIRPPTKFMLPDLFVRINNFKWLNILKNKFAIVIKLNKNNILNIKSLNNLKDYYFEICPYIDEQDINLFQQTINFLFDKGCRNFFINNISHFEFFNNKKVKLFAGQNLYVLNDYSAEFLFNRKVDAFVTSWEDDLYNIKDLAKNLKNNLIVYLSGFPEVVISKMKFADEVKNKNIKSGMDEFKVVSNVDDNIVIPKYPINLLGFKNNLLKCGIKTFGIDLSYIEPNINYFTQIVKAFNIGVYINSKNKFNFERRLK